MSQTLTYATLQNNPKLIAEIYFDAMTTGYASSASKSTWCEVANLPGSKQILYEDGQWRVSDTWEVSKQSDFSGGTTRIYFNGHLVWMMQYFGRYPQHVIPFLKQALALEYTSRTFRGGRGPYTFEEAGLIYVNDPDGDFRSFSGQEGIANCKDEKQLGWHRYHGGLMI